MHSLKCVVVGDGAVGKTCLLVSHTDGEFPGEYIPTVFDNYAKSIMHDNVCYHVQYWDTAGQEDYDRLRPLSYQGAEVFLLCYSVISQHSLNNIREKWYPDIEKYAPNSAYVLVGCKADLRTENTTDIPLENFVNQKQVHSLGKFIKAYKTIECSALTGENLDLVFEYAIKCSIEHKLAKEDKSGCQCIIL